MDVQPVVVGIDGSSTSRDALIWAVHEARLRGAPLHVIHACPHPTYDPVFAGGFCLPPIVLEEEETDVALDCAGDLVRETAPEVPVETWACRGSATSVLLDQAQDGAGLVVVGSRGLGAAGALFLGSVSARVAARATVPVVVVPPGTEHSAAGPVVVGVDGTPHSTAAVRAGAREAAVRGVPLELVSAHLVPADLLVSPLTPPVDLRSAYMERAERVVGEAARTARALGPHLEVRTHVVEGLPTDALAQVAGSTASLVVLGSRGHGLLTGPVLGSVSQSVLHHATGPVMVVHAQD